MRASEESFPTVSSINERGLIRRFRRRRGRGGIPRRLSYKARVLAEYEELDKAGKGALLRREGLYSSLISARRQQRRDQAAAAGSERGRARRGAGGAQQRKHVDNAPAAVYHELLDQGLYLASISTMYRILREHDEVHERRRQAVHPARVKPELVATKPNMC